MNEKKKSLLVLLNPITWLAAIFAPLLRFLGLLSPPNTEGFENLTRANVDEAAADAKRAEEAIDAIVREMSPAEVVRAYARSDVDTRATMDISALDLEGQDWLLNLSDGGLCLLGMSTMAACARSLEARAVLPAYPRPQLEKEAPGILAIPSAENEEEKKRRYIAERFQQVERELWLSPGVSNPKPQHVPITIH